MGRLIDADKLLETLQDLEPHCENKDYECGMFSTMRYYMPKIINDEPTAYDVDKVVAEFNELDVTAIKRYEGGTFGNYEGTDYYIEKSKAIEIVKQGDVTDDVCEWQSDYGFISDKYKRETSCGYTFYDLHHAVPFKFCPYCGKKIKVVD